MDSDAIRAWLAALDDLSYYDLLGVPKAAGADEIRQGFYRFATEFHPDAHAMRDADEKNAINSIFKRGTEAYRVLGDPTLRMHYDDAHSKGARAARHAALSQHPHGTASLHVPPPSLAPRASVPAGEGGGAPGDAPATIQGRLEDYVRQARARPFAQKAEELAKKKEYAKAKLELRLAMNMDPGNPALEAYLKDLDAESAAQKGKR